ncbi:MAG: DUF4178 domain-containing protein [Bacteroidota bacterium]
MELSPLDRALGAARRGHHEAARTLLDGVLAQDGTNEEALVWRARVAETDADRASYLQRALAINPQNRWAAGQLEEIGGDGVVVVQPTSDTLQCPNCGGSVGIHPGRGAKAAVCTYCGSVLELTAGQADIIGQMNPKVGPDQPILPGDEATFDGENHLVMGWMRYEGWDDEDRWQWDEWQLVSDSGTPRYLSWSRDEGWLLQTPIRPTPKVTRGGIKLASGRAGIKETSPARIKAMQGEFTFRPQIGQTLRVLEAQRGKQHYSAELTADEIEVVGGPKVPERALWEAFGREDKLREMDERAERRRQRRKSLRRAALLCFAVAGLYFLGIGWAASKGETVTSASSEFIAQERNAPVPAAPAPSTFPGNIERVDTVVREPFDVSSFEIGQLGQTYEVTTEATRADGSSSSSDIQLYIVDPSGTSFRVASLNFLGDSRDRSFAFRPVQGGIHTLQAWITNDSPERIAFSTTVQRGMWEPGSFAAAFVLAGLLGVVLFLAGGFGRID